MENSQLAVLGEQAQREIAPVAAQAQLVAESIQDQPSYDAAGQYLMKIKTARKRVAEILDPFVKAAHAAWKAASAERDKYDDPLNAAEAIVKPAMAKWWQIEHDRIEADRRRIEAEDRRRAEERALQEAEEAAKNGDHAQADAILEQPIQVAPPIVPATPQTKGISMREDWKCEVTNLMELVRAVSVGKVPLSALQANTVFLGQQARSLKSECKYPGVRVWPVKTVSSRSF